MLHPWLDKVYKTPGIPQVGFAIKYSRMPKYHSSECTTESARTGHSSLFGGLFLVILVHSGNDNDNDNKFCVPSANNFHSCIYALKTCSYHLCHTAYVLYSSHSYCILVVLIMPQAHCDESVPYRARM